MVYITGDVHGDISRFKSREMRKLKKNDTLIICGDFGFLWDGSKAEQKLLKWIGKRRYHVLFLEGTHENLDILSQYPKTDWQGGAVRELSGKLRHLCRGSIFQIEGQSIFVFGGGASEDSDALVEGEAWWSGDQPAQDELDAARKQLGQLEWQVDYILTHQPSLRIRQLLNMDTNECSVLDMFLDEIRSRCKYRRWFFGSLHIDKVIPPVEMAVFRQVLPLSPL